MQKMLFIGAAFALVAAPAVAQTAPGASAQAQARGSQVEAPKMVKKTICKKIEESQTTGSRLGSTTKVCKTIEVPATEADKGQAPHGTRGEAR
ncbi:MAG TPA: hypothetical protein VFS69_03175 [Sphingomicrobium sp.]|nr:hypothetical protein [Sphingomicrobium sp.]